MGLVKLKVAQIGSMDNDLRIGLWNAFLTEFVEEYGGSFLSSNPFASFYKAVWAEHFKRSLGTLDVWVPKIIDDISCSAPHLD